MNVPPNDIEKIACPSAAAIVLPSMPSKLRLPRYHLKPSPAPSRVTARAINTIRMINSVGMMILLMRSMPRLRPFTRMKPHAPKTSGVAMS